MKNNFIDIPTGELIFDATVKNDHLYIFCEKSVWKLVATKNINKPFKIKKIKKYVWIK